MKVFAIDFENKRKFGDIDEKREAFLVIIAKKKAVLRLLFFKF